MAYPQRSPSVQVGVVLSRQPDNLAEWLADAAAFEAAGADLLWLDLEPAPDLDPLAVTAALAAVTFRSLLVVTVPPPGTAAGVSARTLHTIGRLSRGRLRMVADPTRAGLPAETGLPADSGAAMGSGRPVDSGAATGSGGPVDSGPAIFRRIPGPPEVFEHNPAPGGSERWAVAPLPESRTVWRTTLLDAAERGWRGVLVPADPRLLDLLRNPDDPGDRRDLQLAMG